MERKKILSLSKKTRLVIKIRKQKDKRRRRVLEKLHWIKAPIPNKNKAKGSAYEQRIANRLTNEFGNNYKKNLEAHLVPLYRIN